MFGNSNMATTSGLVPNQASEGEFSEEQVFPAKDLSMDGSTEDEKSEKAGNTTFFNRLAPRGVGLNKKGYSDLLYHMQHALIEAGRR
jgi:hypothetical protein